MRGEAATVHNIGKMIEDEVDDMTDQISQMTDDFFSKKKDNRHSKNILNRFVAWIQFALNATIHIVVSLCNIILSILGLKKI